MKWVVRTDQLPRAISRMPEQQVAKIARSQNMSAAKVDVVKEAAALLSKMGVSSDLYQGGDRPPSAP